MYLRTKEKKQVIFDTFLLFFVLFLRFAPESGFKEFEPRLKFEMRLKYAWFHLKLYSMFQDLSRRSIQTGFRRSGFSKLGGLSDLSPNTPEDVAQIH